MFESIRSLALLCLVCLMAGRLCAIRPSASSMALASISLLSDFVEDATISPISPATGFALTYISPYATPGIHLYGMHQGYRYGRLKLGAGTGYLTHEDYISHNPYLNIAWLMESLSLGANLRMDYDSVGGDGEYRIGADIGMGGSYKGYESELRALDVAGEEREVGLLLARELNEVVKLGAAYIHPNKERGSLRIATTYALHPNLGFCASWTHYPASFGGGVKISHDKLKLIYSIKTHTELSPGHALSMEYNW